MHRAALLFALASSACTIGEDFVPGDVVLLAAYDLDANTERVSADIELAGGDVDRLYPTIGVVRLVASEGMEETIASLDSIVAIEHVLGVDRHRTASQPYPAGAVGTQTTPWGVTRVGGPADPVSATLWVLDTGVDLEHPDLRIDVARSIDLVEIIDPDDEGADTHHGTAVAGVAAAIDNDRDVVGVAPGALVASVRVLDSSGNGRSDVFVAGLEHTAELSRPGDVINISIAARGRSQVMETALARIGDRGISIVVAAGNLGSDAAEFTPAGLVHPNIYTVSAVGQDGCLTPFSNHGATIAAPGEDVVTLAPGGGITVGEGTSLAAPHVAGLLLAGSLESDGWICADRDDSAEPIAHR